MQSKRSRKEVEDPHNTWNKQLMGATLRFDISEAEALIAKGADPVTAREFTPFSKGDLISPLSALMLQGILSPEALDMAQFLVDHGASLDDLMNLPGSAHFTTPVKVEEPAASRVPTSSGRKGSAEPESRATSAGRPTSGGSRLGSGNTEEVVVTEQSTERGTMLHYVVALGDHAHLLKMLMVAGTLRPALPQSLMHEVELGIMIPPKTVPAEERAPSRGKGSKARSNSLSRRPSRLGAGRPPPEGHAPRSALPALTTVPSPADGFRLRKPKPKPVEENADGAEEGGSGAEGGAGATSTPNTTEDKRWHASGLAGALPATLHVKHSEDMLSVASESEPELLFNFSTKGSTGLDVVEWALDHGDITAARLLSFYGAKMDFQRLVNGSQTALARACSNGDVALVERLLDAGDTMTQISADGRYTLVHYAAAHPTVLDYLGRRGLSLDCENAFSESALISLIRHGYGRNADHAIRETPRMSDATKLAALPHAAVRNYILTPLPPLVGGFGSKSKGANRLGKSSSREPVSLQEEQKNVIGGREAGTWWSFSALPTCDMIQHLFDAGANFHGCIPHEEADLRYNLFQEEMTRTRANNVGQSYSSHPIKKRGSIPSASIQEETLSPYDPTQLLFTDEMAHGRVPFRITPLMCAISAYHPELIRKLLMDYHVDVSRRDSMGACCLHYAAVCPHPSVLEVLLTPAVLHSSPALDVNACDMAGRTPLHYAVAMGQLETVKLLLAHPNVLAGRPDVYGLTPLHLAVLANEQKSVELLLSHSDSMLGAVNSVSQASAGKSSRRQKTSKSATPSASSSSPNLRSGAATTSVAGGVDYQLVEVEAEDYVDHCTPLEMAIKHHRDAAIVQLLLGEGHANMQRWSGLEDGGSLLHRAVVDNREDYVRILLDNFADPNEPDNEEFTPLYLAVDRENPNVELIRSLVNAGAFSYAQSGTNLRTPLHVAAQRGHPEVLQLLFHDRANRFHSGDGRRRRDRGYDDEPYEEEEDQRRDGGSGPPPRTPTAPPLIPSGFFLTTDSLSRTPLHVLCSHDRPQVQQRVLPLIQELMKCDANLYMCSILDARGRTPLHEACRANYLDAVRLLLAVDPLTVYYVDGYGNTPLHDAMYTMIRRDPPLYHPENRTPTTRHRSNSNNYRAANSSSHNISDRGGASATVGPMSIIESHHSDEESDLPPDEEHFTRMEELIVTLITVVQQTVPRQLSGIPLVSSDVHHISPMLSITAQLMQQKRYKNRWLEGPNRMTTDSYGTPSEDLLVKTVQEYMRLPDKHGRTPLLLAGELGNTVAARTIMQLSSVAPTRNPAVQL